MSLALHAFMDTLIDYAGLFPPAALDVPAAAVEYARHRREPEHGMLGRFISPAARLGEVAAETAGLGDAGTGWEFSVLVGARDGADAALAALPGQAEAIRLLESGPAGHLVPALEAAVPLDADADFPTRFAAALAEAGMAGRELYLEVLPGDDDEAVVTAIAAAAAADTAFPRIGAKLRCGGVTPEAFPTCERVAGVIAACARLDLPLKCTAGLHHPVRHRAATPPVMMHGFLNVFGAGLLAWSGVEDPHVLTECVAETDPAAFGFDDEAFTWRDHRVPVEAIRRIRGRALCGFGSCSFAEPRADLQQLGLM